MRLIWCRLARCKMAMHGEFPGFESRCAVADSQQFGGLKTDLESSATGSRLHSRVDIMRGRVRAAEKIPRCEGEVAAIAARSGVGRGLVRHAHLPPAVIRAEHGRRRLRTGSRGSGFSAVRRHLLLSASPAQRQFMPAQRHSSPRAGRALPIRHANC